MVGDGGPKLYNCKYKFLELPFDQLNLIKLQIDIKRATLASQRTKL